MEGWRIKSVVMPNTYSTAERLSTTKVQLHDARSATSALRSGVLSTAALSIVPSQPLSSSVNPGITCPWLTNDMAIADDYLYSHPRSRFLISNSLFVPASWAVGDRVLLCGPTDLRGSFAASACRGGGSGNVWLSFPRFSRHGMHAESGTCSWALTTGHGGSLVWGMLSISVATCKAAWIYGIGPAIWNIL